MTRLLAILALLFALAANPALADGTDLASALSANKPLVLVVAATTKAAKASDTYADWQGYYQDFAAKTELPVVTVTPKQYAAAVSSPKLSGDFATLFIRDSGHVLMLDEKALEPAIYRLGSAYLATGEVTEEAGSYGLSEVALAAR